jgi:hypothetical protein
MRSKKKDEGRSIGAITRVNQNDEWIDITVTIMPIKKYSKSP